MYSILTGCDVSAHTTSSGDLSSSLSTTSQCVRGWAIRLSRLLHFMPLVLGSFVGWGWRGENLCWGNCSLGQCLWSKANDYIYSQVNLGSNQTYSAPTERDASGEVFLTGGSRLPASTRSIPNNSSFDDLEDARRISFTSAASPVCRLQFFQHASNEKENRCEDAIEGSPTCEGVLIYDDLEGKPRFF